MRRRWWRATRMVGVIVGLALVAGASSLNEEEFNCEMTVSHLEDCCPGFDGSDISCYRASDCARSSYGGTDFPLEKSRCLLEKSCDSLRSAGACERLVKVVACLDRRRSGLSCDYPPVTTLACP